MLTQIVYCHAIIPYFDQGNPKGLNGLKIIIKETEFIKFVFRFFPFANILFNIQFIFEFR